MKFSVDNCVEMMEKDLKKEMASFAKKKGKAPDLNQTKSLKILVGFDYAERYVAILEESVMKNASAGSTNSQVPIIRAQWNLCLNSATREGITVDDNENHLMNFVDYVNWVSADENVMFSALRKFITS